MFDRPFRERLRSCERAAVRHLLESRNSTGHWTGELSASALSTATAVMALWQVLQQQPGRRHTLRPLITNGCDWLIQQQNDDGGWGDTIKSVSNISTTMLCHATLAATRAAVSSPAGPQQESIVRSRQSTGASESLQRAKSYIDQAGGVPALVARYDKDKTFSVPILTHCALAGLVRWRDITPLPFELACVPANFYKTVRLPVVSYALPALIAIGQVRHHFAPTRNPVTRALRNLAISRSLKILERIQPEGGGFLEATPLTSFVTMSLAAMGLHDHPVTRHGVEFIIRSVRKDGSWPIDTNLATWVTTLSVNALGEALPEVERRPIADWLLGQQYKVVHPYTNADPGGWGWTDLPGGVPDADDTPGAMLALTVLTGLDDPLIAQAVGNAENWLLSLQNRDGGWPTFCRGWGTLPFDRSSPDITAHVLRALNSSRVEGQGSNDTAITHSRPLTLDPGQAIQRGFRFLERAQRADGSWIPLWFGNQYAPNDINPTYGTAKVLMAYRDCELFDSPAARRGRQWLIANQNADGGWGSGSGTPSSVEETALATEALLSDSTALHSVRRGLEWIMDRVDDGRYADPAPIGFYFAKLWYFERLYPTIFTVSVLRKATCVIEGSASEAASSVGEAIPPP
jgi:squalene-hopene/tetraprenyl-beta-curcumene cyclase